MRAAAGSALLLALGAAPLGAQTVAGIVRDRATGAVVEFATVLLLGARDSVVAVTRSDSTGTFYVQAPSPGTYALRLARGTGPLAASGPIALADAEAFHQAEYAIDVRMDAPFLDVQVDVAAARLDHHPPIFPMRLLDARVAGHAIVEYVVGADGRVELDGVRVIEATHPEFGAALPPALRRARFEPATIAGRAVRQVVRERAAFTFVNRTPTIRIDREPSSGGSAGATRPPA